MDVPSPSRSGSKGPVASAVAGDVEASAVADVVVSTVMAVATVDAMVATVDAIVATAVTADTAGETHTVAADVAAAGDVIAAVTTATPVAMAAGRSLTKVSTRKRGNDVALKRPVRVVIDKLLKDRVA